MKQHQKTAQVFSVLFCIIVFAGLIYTERNYPFNPLGAFSSTQYAISLVSVMLILPLVSFALGAAFQTIHSVFIVMLFIISIPIGALGIGAFVYASADRIFPDWLTWNGILGYIMAWAVLIIALVAMMFVLNIISYYSVKLGHKIHLKYFVEIDEEEMILEEPGEETPTENPSTE